MKNNILIFLFVLVFSSCGNTENNLSKKADRIHRKILTVDMHCDTPLNLVGSDFDPGKRNNEGCVDFPRMIEGGLDSEFFAIFISQGARNDTAYQNAHKTALEMFEAIHKSLEKNSALAELALTPDDALKIKKKKKRAIFICLENGYPIGRNLDRIREYYDLGARYITLCHSGNNDICDSSNDPKGPENYGLSPFGEEVVKKMNEIGMIVDVSHISDESFFDVLKVSKAPVIASHSSCRALCSSPRNLTDEMLLALKENGGVIHICILSNFIKTPEPNPELNAKLKEHKESWGDIKKLTQEQQKEYRSQRKELQSKYKRLATVADVVDHIDHVVQVIGIDYVGIGTDFDGGGAVEGCSSVAEMKNITLELLRRRYSKSDIKKIWGTNSMRVFREVEAIAGKDRI